MTSKPEDQLPPAAEEEELRPWRPSGIAEHVVGQQPADGSTTIIERSGRLGVGRSMLRFLQRPFVRLILALGTFIFAALVYDATINRGDWMEKQERQKATQHKGLPPVPRTPD